MPEISDAAGQQIIALAQRLKAFKSFRLQAQPTSETGDDHARTIRLRGPDGSESFEILTLRQRDKLLLTADESACAIIGDFNGDENYTLRIYTVTKSGLRLVHLESPISPCVYAFGTGLLWIRRDAARRPYKALWWDRNCEHPEVLFEEIDRTRRLSLRSVDDDIAILASKGADTINHRIITSGDAIIPTCHLSTQDIPDGDLMLWHGDIIVLDRAQGQVRADGDDPLTATAPADFITEHLQRAGDEIAVVGRYRGRQAFWLPAQGPAALWTAPPAGIMLPSIDPATKRQAFLVSSPVHEPQVVFPSENGEVPAVSTGRAVDRCLTANSDDNTPIPITIFLPPNPGPRPLVVHVYGAYGISLEGPFDPFTDDLLARGIAVAYCHVRGGGENGPTWHQQATGTRRHQSITDLLACLALFHNHPAIIADRIALVAASAGGFTAAAACLRQPTWVRGLQLVHPFIDPVTALLDPGSNLTTTDWAEFGNPRADPRVKNYLEQLSPAATVRSLDPHSCPLPRAWIRTAEQDARVDSAAVKQFCELYRAAAISTDVDHVVYRVTTGGHIEGQSFEQAHEENLLAHAWLLNLLDSPCIQAI